MKVILLDDVAAVGRRGEVRDVSDGYARNFLIPKKLALSASAGNLKNLQHIKNQQDAKAEDGGVTDVRVQHTAHEVRDDRAKPEGERLVQGLARRLQFRRKQSRDRQDDAHEDPGEGDPADETRRDDEWRGVEHDPRR